MEIVTSNYVKDLGVEDKCGTITVTLWQAGKPGLGPNERAMLISQVEAAIADELDAIGRDDVLAQVEYEAL